jgi:hypothetical protein
VIDDLGTLSGAPTRSSLPVGHAEPVPPYPVDPIGDDDVPLFDDPADMSARVDEMLAEGFGL